MKLGAARQRQADAKEAPRKKQEDEKENQEDPNYEEESDEDSDLLKSNGEVLYEEDNIPAEPEKQTTKMTRKKKKKKGKKADPNEEHLRTLHDTIKHITSNKVKLLRKYPECEDRLVELVYQHYHLDVDLSKMQKGYKENWLKVNTDSCVTYLNQWKNYVAARVKACLQFYARNKKEYKLFEFDDLLAVVERKIDVENEKEYQLMDWWVNTMLRKLPNMLPEFDEIF